MAEPKPTQSYFAQAQLDAALEEGGRFAGTYHGRSQGTQAYLIGSEAECRPPIPAPSYGRDPGGADPLGFAIDDLPDQTTVSGLPREPR